MKRLYQPKPSRLMRVAALFSGGASALKYLLENDPHLNVKYRFVGTFTDRKNAAGIELARRAGIPMEILDYREFMQKSGAKFSDLEVRREYFSQVAERIRKWKPDILMLSGFMLIVTEPLLSEYRSRILNVHPADLSVLDEQGRRKYVGKDAVAKAILSGEPYTKSTIHLVTEEVDGGPLVVQSQPLKVEAGISPEQHQEAMKWACDGPAYQKALELIADGKVWLDERTAEIQIVQ